ncbi:Per1-like protein [Choanephora cucurbitarum]|nr:Per1-like protein [Choanephora cucurbitarum]
MMLKSMYFLLLCSFSLIAIVIASEGDEEPVFIYCANKCSYLSCPTQLDFFLRLLQWTCPENCRYECMQKITDYSVQHHKTIYQYFGKWPFYRAFGIQEPASVLFSIGNGLVQAYAFMQLWHHVPSTYFLRPWMLLYTIIGMNAWVWSTVFHSRDKEWTQLLDYFSAAMYVLYSLYFALLRVFSIRTRTAVISLTSVCVCLYIAHVIYLTAFSFDYVYNMIANVIIGTLQVLVWIGWYVQQKVDPDAVNRSYAHLAVISGVGVSLALCLELFDFPPLWRVFDAHSLWHLSTIPLTAIWYQFLLEDMRFETGLQHHPIPPIP